MAKKKAPETIGASPYDASKWRARNDLETLSRAQEIAQDKARLRNAQAEAKKQIKGLQEVAGGDRAARRKRLEGVKL